MGIFSFLKSSEKAVDTAASLIDAGVNGIDKLFFTDEEKAEASSKFYENWISTLKLLVDTESIRSITRRYLAISVIGTWLLLIITGTSVYIAGLKDAAEFTFRVVQDMTVPVLAVIGFYFGPEMISRVLGRSKK